MFAHRGHDIVAAFGIRRIELIVHAVRDDDDAFFGVRLVVGEIADRLDERQIQRRLAPGLEGFQEVEHPARDDIVETSQRQHLLDIFARPQPVGNWFRVLGLPEQLLGLFDIPTDPVAVNSQAHAGIAVVGELREHLLQGDFGGFQAGHVLRAAGAFQIGLLRHAVRAIENEHDRRPLAAAARDRHLRRAVAIRSEVDPRAADGRSKNGVTNELVRSKATASNMGPRPSSAGAAP